MPIVVTCEACDTKLSAPDGAEGKKVRCPKCGDAVPVPGGSASRVTAGPPPRSRKASFDEDEDEDENEEERPKSRLKKKAPPPDDDEDDDVVDAEEAEEEDEPRTKKKKKKSQAGGGLYDELSADEEAEVRDMLRGKERVVWAGKPSTKLMVLRSIPVMIGGCFFFVISIIVFAAFSKGPKTGGGAIEVVIPIIFIVVGVILCTAPIWAKFRAARTFYALTNRRALIWKGGYLWGTSYEEYSAMQIVNYKRQNSWFVNGAGDLVFREEVHITRHHNSRGGSHTTVRIIQHGFIAIPDVREVEYLIQRKIVDKFNRILDD
jgi:hypothetical protein